MKVCRVDVRPREEVHRLGGGHGGGHGRRRRRRVATLDINKVGSLARLTVVVKEPVERAHVALFLPARGKDVFLTHSEVSSVLHIVSYHL